MGRVGLGGERAAEGDHLAHGVRHDAGDLAGEDAAEAPADQAHLAAVALALRLDRRTEALEVSAAGCRADRGSGRSPSRRVEKPAPSSAERSRQVVQALAPRPG